MNRPEPGEPLLHPLLLLLLWAGQLSIRSTFVIHRVSGGNGIRTHDTISLYVDLANRCLEPLSHTSIDNRLLLWVLSKNLIWISLFEILRTYKF